MVGKKLIMRNTGFGQDFGDIDEHFIRSTEDWMSAII